MINNNYICHTPYLRNSIAYDHDDICRSFFQFFDIFIFWAVRGVKGQKMAQDDKNLSVAVDISGNIYHMIVPYGTLV